MASYQFLNHPNQVRDSYSCNIRHGGSKTQICLSKILHIISSFPPCETSLEPNKSPQIDAFRDEDRASCCGNRGFDTDLSLRFGLPPETRESESPDEDVGLSACSAVGTVVESESPEVCAGVSVVDKVSGGECDRREIESLNGRDFPATEANRNGEEAEEIGEMEAEVSEITNLQVRSSEIENDGVLEENNYEVENRIKEEEEEHQLEAKESEDEEKAEKKLFWKKEYKSEGYLGLLIEAAKLISGDFADDEPELEKPSRNHMLRHEFGTQKRITETEPAINESIRSGSKREACWMVKFYGDFEDVSPVVRSKRGRSQVLPYRYRDSVLEPWKRLQRSTTVSKKRRSR